MNQNKQSSEAPIRDVFLEFEQQIAIITLSNESRYNAMSLSMWIKLADILSQLKQSNSVRAVIIKGAGEKAFVSGADISEFGEQRNDPQSVANYDRAVSNAQAALVNFPAPVIASISGICFGGGLGLALACDLRYASENSKFRMPAARLGLGYAFAGLKRMNAILGTAKASELFYTAKICTASEAMQLGLLNGVTANAFDQAKAVAHTIAKNAPLTIKAAKLAFNALLSGEQRDRIEEVDLAVKDCFSSADYAEGRLAFAQKRDPVFNGK
jgi:enoyl-CoA hydratase/carnithine racemase